MPDMGLVEKALQVQERTESDRSFAARERELIATLKDLPEAEQKTAIRELTHSRCPHCGGRLELRPFQGAQLQVCRMGHGAWIGKEQMETFAQGSEHPWGQEFIRLMTSLMNPPIDEYEMKQTNFM